jgi:hypothetical protein
MDQMNAELLDRARRVVGNITDAYERWRRTRAPGAAIPRPWSELTITEAEIAAGMYGMGVRAVAELVDDQGDPQMRDLILEKLL